MANGWREHHVRVRERAYEIWQREGRPEGNATTIWLQAEAELDASPNGWREHRVRARAYEIWQREGRPEGNAAAHWLQAEAELDASQVDAVREACNREVLSCFRLAAALGLWRRELLRRQWLALLTAIGFGGAAVLQVLMRFGGRWADIAAGLLILGTVWALAAYVAMRIRPDSEVEYSSAEFLNLRDRFQRAAELDSLRSIDEFVQEFRELMDRKADARRAAPVLPEKHVRAAENIATTAGPLPNSWP
jgi:Protein of unknown function (DUF2934)